MEEDKRQDIQVLRTTCTWPLLSALITLSFQISKVIYFTVCTYQQIHCDSDTPLLLSHWADKEQGTTDTDCWSGWVLAWAWCLPWNETMHLYELNMKELLEHYYHYSTICSTTTKLTLKQFSFHNGQLLLLFLTHKCYLHIKMCHQVHMNVCKNHSYSLRSPSESLCTNYIKVSKCYQKGNKIGFCIAHQTIT